MLAIDVNGRSVKTIEAFENDLVMKNIQEILLKNSSVQCGFCIPSIALVIRKILVDEVKDLNIAIEYLKGNLCRCTGYVSIIESLKEIFERNK